MPTEIIEELVDIYQYPKKCIRNNSTSITIGDLHGNAVKLMYFLLRHGVIQFNKHTENPQREYLQFVQLYNQLAQIVEIRRNAIEKIKYEEINTIQIQSDLFKLYSMEEDQRLNPLLVRSEEQQATYQDLKRSVQWLKDSVEKKRKANDELSNEKLKKLPSLADLVEQFNGFITQLEVIDNLTLVRLIGDEFADRGSSDYFTLKLLSFLRQNEVKVTILISNHASEFITAYEHLSINEGFVPQGAINDFQKPSFYGLKYLLDDGIVSSDEVMHLIESSYKPTLKIIDYTLNEEGIRLFTHAPVDFDIIRHFAQKLGVFYRDITEEYLGSTIDKINTKFQYLVSRNELHKFFAIPSGITINTMSEKQIAEWPFIYIIWNRFNETKDKQGTRPDILNGYKIQYIHGHDIYQSDLHQIINLDTICGKEMYVLQKIKIRSAKKVLFDVNESFEVKKRAKNYLDSVNNIKIIKSTESGLDERHDIDLINEELIQSKLMSSTKKNLLITGSFVILGLVIGIAISTPHVLTDMLSPFGVGILGSIAFVLTTRGGFAALLGGLGFGIAKATQAPPVNTVIIIEEPVFNINMYNGSVTKLKDLSIFNGIKDESNKTIENGHKIIPNKIIPVENLCDEITFDENRDISSAKLGMY